MRRKQIALSLEENMRLSYEVHGLSNSDIDGRLGSVIEVVPQLKDMLKPSGAALWAARARWSHLEEP
jgi:hypothetical protein